MAYFAPNRAPGKLIVFEGVSASGKSTHLRLLARWLQSERYVVVTSESPDPALECPLRAAAELAHRVESCIAPMLKAGAVVLTEGYATQGIADAVVRGYPKSWARNLYRFAVAPDLLFGLRLPVSTALARKRLEPGAGIAQAAALSLGLSPNAEESFRLYQARFAEEHENMLEGISSARRLDVSGPVPEVQARIRSGTRRSLAAAKLVLRNPREEDGSLAAAAGIP